jgi:hypothetical protein
MEEDSHQNFQINMATPKATDGEQVATEQQTQVSMLTFI